MKNLVRSLLGLTFAVCFFGSAAQAQNRYEGYSLIVEAGDQGNAPCPVQYAPYANATITVTIPGTNAAATGLVACDGSTILHGNMVIPNGATGRWCFTGPQASYNVTHTNVVDVTYLWFPNSNSTGFFNVKDFGAKGDGVTDDTKAIKNAVAYIAARQGGTLYFPEGDFIVGTINGTAADPAFKGIALPSGITIEGASALLSTPTTNLPANRSACRIHLKFPNQSIFRVGGCTQRVTIKKIELLSDSSDGTIGVEALGYYNGVLEARSTYHTRFEQMSFQNFYRSIYAHALDPDHIWQFESVKVEHCQFLGSKNAAIYIDTWDTEWHIESSFIHMVPRIAHTPTKGDGIYIYRAGMILIENTFGGGNSEQEGQRGGDFIHTEFGGNLTIINSQAERLTNSLIYGGDPYSGNYSYPLTLVNNLFGAPVLLNARCTFVSTGNHYGPDTVQTTSGVRIYSTGDRFCYDTYIGVPGQPTPCLNSGGTHGGDFRGTGRIMFRTGQPAEAGPVYSTTAVPTRIGDDLNVTNEENDNAPLFSLKTDNFTKPVLRLGQSNFYYEFKRSGLNGFLLFNGNQGIPYKGYQFDGPVQLHSASWAQVQQWQTVVGGALIYCHDCGQNANGDCVGNGSSAIAKLINVTWKCN